MQTGSDGNGMLWLADFSTLDKCNQTRVRAWCQFIPTFQPCLQSRICIFLWAPFLSPDASYSLLCSSWGSSKASGHIPEQGNVLYLTMLQCTTQQLLNLIQQRQNAPGQAIVCKSRVHNAPAAHTWEPVQVSSLLPHIHDRTEENGSVIIPITSPGTSSTFPWSAVPKLDTVFQLKCLQHWGILHVLFSYPRKTLVFSKNSLTLVIAIQTMSHNKSHIVSQGTTKTAKLSYSHKGVFPA